MDATHIIVWVESIRVGYVSIVEIFQNKLRID
jgi:hypothetical protein